MATSSPAGPAPPGPTSSHERIDLLDAIRGVALGGILLANLMSFIGADMLSPGARRAQPLAAVGDAVLFGVNWLVEGKFYPVFSMLFGAGFALQAARALRRHETPARFHAFFRRRMLVLVAIGLVHMYLLWAGDILALYGVMGLLLLSVARWTPRARVLAAAALFVVPLRPMPRCSPPAAGSTRGRPSPPSAPMPGSAWASRSAAPSRSSHRAGPASTSRGTSRMPSRGPASISSPDALPSTGALPARGLACRRGALRPVRPAARAACDRRGGRCRRHGLVSFPVK